MKKYYRITLTNIDKNWLIDSQYVAKNSFSEALQVYRNYINRKHLDSQYLITADNAIESVSEVYTCKHPDNYFIETTFTDVVSKENENRTYKLYN